jgi:hypothetical protein
VHISFGIWDVKVSYIPFTNPKALVLYGKSERGDEDDLYPIDHFISIQKLVLVGLQNLQSQSLQMLKQLNYLTMELATFDDCVLNLPPSLEELCISHHGINHFSMDSPPEFPYLRVLGITPYELQLFQNANLPVLRKVILYAPLAAPSLDLDDCIQNAAPVFRSVEALELYNWEWKEPPWTSTLLSEKLLLRIPGLLDTKFVRCFVDGPSLIEALSKHEPGKPKISITFDQCKGLTRADCEILLNSESSLVSSLSVLV